LTKSPTIIKEGGNLKDCSPHKGMLSYLVRGEKGIHLMMMMTSNGSPSGGKNGKSRGEISSQPVVYLFYNADEQRLREIEQGKRKLK
jgi:hypothetical protein